MYCTDKKQKLGNFLLIMHWMRVLCLMSLISPFSIANGEASMAQPSLEWALINSSYVWYSKIEQCVFLQGKIEKRLELTYKNCNGICPHYPAFGLGVGQRVGPNGAPLDCVPSYPQKTFFKMEMPFFHSVETNVVETLHALATSNRILVFVGDSLSRQNADALAGEVVRVHPGAKIHVSNPSVLNVNFPEYIIKRLEKELPQKQSLFLVNFHRNADRLKEAVVVEIEGYPLMVYTFFFGPSHYHTSSFAVPKTFAADIEYLKVIEAHHNGMAIVVNSGLWGTSRVFLRSLLVELNDMALVAREKGKIIDLFWRETTAGHFPTETGYSKGISMASSCVPHVNNATEHHQSPLIKEIIAEGNLSFHFIPFYKATKPLYNMHIGNTVDELVNYGQKKGGKNITLDCLHYCWMPTLWQPVWYSLHSVIVK